jgi:hypothetical protein
MSSFRNQKVYGSKPDHIGFEYNPQLYHAFDRRFGFSLDQQTSEGSYNILSTDQSARMPAWSNNFWINLFKIGLFN